MKTFLKASIILMYVSGAASCSSSQSTEGDVKSVDVTKAHVAGELIDDALPEYFTGCAKEADLDAVDVRTHDNEVSHWIGGLMGDCAEDPDLSIGSTCPPAWRHYQAQLPTHIRQGCGWGLVHVKS